MTDLSQQFASDNYAGICPEAWEVTYTPANQKQPVKNSEVLAAYSGQLGEAGTEMDLSETAIHSLVERGMVDPTKIGIIGFSRTGWEVEFMLAHSVVPFGNLHARMAQSNDT